jgi:hypothetical protein
MFYWSNERNNRLVNTENDKISCSGRGHWRRSPIKRYRKHWRPFTEGPVLPITSVLTPLLMAMIVDTLLHRHSNPDTPISSKKCLYIVIYVKAVSTVEEAGRCQAQAHEITWALKKNLTCSTLGMYSPTTSSLLRRRDLTYTSSPGIITAPHLAASRGKALEQPVQQFFMRAGRVQFTNWQHVGMTINVPPSAAKVGMRC